MWTMSVAGLGSFAFGGVATMVGTRRRASAYGLFTAAFGIAWFLGSALLGWLYDVSILALVVAAVALELAAVPFLVVVSRSRR